MRTQLVGIPKRGWFLRKISPCVTVTVTPGVLRYNTKGRIRKRQRDKLIKDLMVAWGVSNPIQGSRVFFRKLTWAVAGAESEELLPRSAPFIGQLELVGHSGHTSLPSLSVSFCLSPSVSFSLSLLSPLSSSVPSWSPSSFPAPSPRSLSPPSPPPTSISLLPLPPTLPPDSHQQLFLKCTEPTTISKMKVSLSLFLKLVLGLDIL